MGFFDKIAGTGAVPQTAQGDAPVSPEVAECDEKLAELEARRDDLIMQVGRLYLAENPPEKLTGTPYEENAKAIAAIDKEREFYEKRKLAVQGLRRCEGCGNILVRESAFCNRCGKKLEPLFSEESDGKKVCPNCGTPYDEETMFCANCGTKLG